MKYRKVNKLSSVDAAYLAGLIDADGSITLVLRKKPHRQPVVSVSNTDYNLVRWPHKITNAGHISTKSEKKKAYHKTAYIWAAHSNQALDILKQILPYLKESKKKTRAKFLIDNYKKVTLRNGKYTKKLLEKKEEFVKEFFCISGQGSSKLTIALENAMKALNIK